MSNHLTGVQCSEDLKFDASSCVLNCCIFFRTHYAQQSRGRFRGPGLDVCFDSEPFKTGKLGATDLCPDLLWVGSVNGEVFGLWENASLKK